MTDPNPDVHGIVRDNEKLFRLYRPEWVIVYVAATLVPYQHLALMAECQTHFDDTYAGRVHPEDVRRVSVGRELCGSCDAGLPQSCTCPPQADEAVQLQLRLPTLKAEFKYPWLAASHAEEQGFDDWTIVVRDSRDDHELRAYGVRKLATP